MANSDPGNSYPKTGVYYLGELKGNLRTPSALLTWRTGLMKRDIKPSSNVQAGENNESAECVPVGLEIMACRVSLVDASHENDGR